MHYSRKIGASTLESRHSTVESLSYWVCIYTRKIGVGKLGCSLSRGKVTDPVAMSVCCLSGRVSRPALVSQGWSVGGHGVTFYCQKGGWLGYHRTSKPTSVFSKDLFCLILLILR